jgi:hypothetical protein
MKCLLVSDLHYTLKQFDWLCTAAEALDPVTWAFLATSKVSTLAPSTDPRGRLEKSPAHASGRRRLGHEPGRG